MTVDPATAAVYRAGADTYASNRPPLYADRAAALREGGDHSGAVLDAGCGTGAYLGALGPRCLGLDAVRPMLERAAHEGRPLVEGDLALLPFRPSGLTAAWARNSYVHLPHAELPLALAELHRALQPGAPVTASFLTGPDDVAVADDDLPGRTFWRWSDDGLRDVFHGAGFTDVELSGDRPRFVSATRARTLPDTVGPDMGLLVCGLNPSLHAADAGIGFVTPGNRFWPAALTAGLVSVDRDPWHAVRRHGMGMTDLVKRATRRADELTPGEFRAGLERLDRLCRRLEPTVVCMVGLSGWRAAVDRTAGAGWQARTLGGRPVYVMPSTSGLNAHCRPADFVEHLRAASSGP